MFGNKKKKQDIKKTVDVNKVDFEDPLYKEKVEGGEETSKESIKTAGEMPYTVELWDVWGSTSKKAVRFGAKRFIEQGNVFLVNEKRNFKEPFPEDTEEYKDMQKDFLESEIKKKEKILLDIKKNKNTDHSERDIKQDIKVLQSNKRSLDLQGKGSYMLIDSDQSGARPLFMFDRRGNYKLPVFKNIDISLMYLPTEAKITEASDLIRENDEKNKKKMTNIAAGVFLVLIVIVLFGALYFAYRTSQLDSGVVEALKDIAVNQDAITEKLSDYINAITNTENPILNESVQPNVNVVND